MTRKRKLLLNSMTSVVYQLVALICGFILPRLFLMNYGSTVNGLISSISQFLGFISLCELGVGAVVQSALYKPLADKDPVSISKIVISSERFFRKIAYILVIYTFGLIIFYPLLLQDDFGFLYTILLIFVISLSTFAQYYFGITYRLLLNADQVGYICYIIQIGTIVANTISCIIMMKWRASIHSVKLVSSIIFILQPLGFSLVAKRRYKINRNLELTEEPIKQKWNGFAQHVAAVVLGNTDTVVLTIFSTLENVSIYAVYNLVVNGIKQIVLSMTSGIQAMFGNMLAKEEMRELNASFEVVEWLIHTIVVLIFSITALLIVPFVSVYTKGVEDVNYKMPIFAVLLTMAHAAYCLRLPYNMMVLAAGHYKQTQCSAIIEAVLNIVISVVMVYQYGLVGVAIGTLVAMVYRTCYLARYLSNNITYRRCKYFYKHILVDVLSVILIFSLVKLIFQEVTLVRLDYLSWIILAIKVGVFSSLSVCAVNIVFYQNLMKKGIQVLICKFRRS